MRRSAKTNFFALVKYLYVALASTIADWIIFWVVIHMIFLPPTSALPIGRLGGGITSFLLNRHWTFRSKGNPALSQVGRFLMLYLVSFTLAYLLFIALLNFSPFGAFKSKLVTDTSIFIFNFLLMKAWVYRM